MENPRFWVSRDEPLFSPLIPPAIRPPVHSPTQAIVEDGDSHDLLGRGEN
jgi:hypothetical protein